MLIMKDLYIHLKYLSQNIELWTTLGKMYHFEQDKKKFLFNYDKSCNPIHQYIFLYNNTLN